MPCPLTISRSVRCSTLILVMFVSGCGGGGSSNDAPPPAATRTEPVRQDGMTAREIMFKMVEVYRKANAYLDNAEYGQHFVFAEDGVQRQGPPIAVAVMFRRPNLFRITRVEPQPEGEARSAVVASDGEKLEASLSQLEPQRLSRPAPEHVTLDNVAPDPLLKQALFPIPPHDMFPQLALLLAQSDETAWPLAAGDSLLLLPQKEITARGSQPRACYRVQMQTTMGPQICWIDKATFLLLRIELPSEVLRKELYPNQQFTSFSWQFNFYDVTLDAQLPSKMFRLASGDAEQVELVEKFTEPATAGEESPSDESAGESDE